MRIVSVVVCLLAASIVAATAAAITGTVFGPGAKPLVGVDVAICSSCGGEPLMVKTDKAGRFSAKTATCTKDKPAIGCRAYVYAYAPGYVPGGAAVTKDSAAIHLEPAGQMWGSVTNEDGSPVFGARVAVALVEQPGGKRLSLGCSPFRDKLSARTTADGRWSITGVPTAGTAYVGISDPNYAEDTIVVMLGCDAVPAPPLVARPAAVLAGRVIYADGKPAQGAFVHCNGHSGGGTAAATDKLGQYKLTSLGTGLYDVMASDKDGKCLAAAIPDVKATTGVVTKLHDLVLTAGTLIKGTVVDADTGAPVVGVYVGASGAHNPSTTGVLNGTTTDSKGAFELRVAPGEASVSVHGKSTGYLSYETAAGESSITVMAKSGVVSRLVIRLKKGLSVTGVVVDQKGTPIADVPVTIRVPLDEHGRAISAAGKSDSYGKFTVAPLQPGTGEVRIGDDSVVDASFFGGWNVVAPKEISVPSDSPVRVVLERDERIPIVGRTAAPDGTPVPGVAVQFRIMVPMDSATDDGGLCTERTLVSDYQGRFGLDGLRPGLQVEFVSAKKQGYEYMSGGDTQKSGTCFSISDLIMARLDATVEGKVVDASGNPVAGAKVTSLRQGLVDPVVTDAAGRFVLKNLPSGEITVMAAFGSSFGTVTAETGNAPVEVRLEPSVE